MRVDLAPTYRLVRCSAVTTLSSPTSAATRRFAGGDADAAFVDAKCIMAHHHAFQMLPQGGALHDMVLCETVTTLGLSDVQF